MISNKVLLNNIPIFNNFNLLEDGMQINPFIHFNLLWTPKSLNLFKSKSTPVEEIVKPDAQEYNPLHVSGGFGVSLLTQAFAIELYYNAYVKKNSYDVGTEFSIKFGID
jgi:hypothetical protein